MYTRDALTDELNRLVIGCKFESSRSVAGRASSDTVAMGHGPSCGGPCDECRGTISAASTRAYGAGVRELQVEVAPPGQVARWVLQNINMVLIQKNHFQRSHIEANHWNDDQYRFNVDRQWGTVAWAGPYDVGGSEARSEAGRRLSNETHYSAN